MLATVFRIADELAISEIHHKIERFERDLTNEDRAVFGNFCDISHALAALNCESDRFEHLNVYNPRGCADGPLSCRPEAEMLNHGFGQGESGGTGVNQSIENNHGLNLLGGQFTSARKVGFQEILDFGGDNHFAQDGLQVSGAGERMSQWI